MSDTLASERTLERPSENGQVNRASEAQPQSDTGGQTSDNGKSAQDENIRKLQSTYDRKLAEQAKAHQAQVQQQNQLIQNLQRQMREAQKNSAPDDYAKLELELQWARQEAQQYAQAYQQTLAERQAEQGLLDAAHDIAEDFDQLTASEIAKAVKEAGISDYKGAYKLAAKLQREREQRKQEQDDDKRERNMPDIGGGAPRTTTSEWEAAYTKAQQERDSVTMARLLRNRPKGGTG